MQDLLDFSAYYQQAKETTEVIKVIDNLFLKLCSFWYRNRENEALYNLSQLYRKHLGIPSKISLLENQVFKGNLSSYCGQNQIIVRGIQKQFPNPVYWIRKRGDIYLTTYQCTTHGDLNGHNILVSDQGTPFLIDFATTGRGHILRDFARLETVIKFTLLSTKRIRNLYAFEQALLSPATFEEFLHMSLPPANNDIKKAFDVIKHLRFRARDVTLPGDRNAAEYYVGLFYTTLSRLSRHQHKYPWLSAAMTCERLDRLLP